MIARTIAPETDLLTFFETEYVPSKASADGALWRYHARERNNVRWFNASIGLSATLGDLTYENLSACARFVVQRGCSGKTAQNVVAAILTLWRFAVWRGYLPESSKPLRQPKGQRKAGLRSRPSRPKPVAKVAPVPDQSPCSATLETTLDYFLLRHYAPTRDISANTLETCIWHVAKFSRHLGRAAKVSDLNTVAINGFLAAAQATISRYSVRTYRGTLLTLWRFAFDESLLPTPPRKIRPMKMPGRVVDGYDVDQVGKLLAAADSLQGTFRKLPIERRAWFTVFTLLCWTTGLRLGDVLAIERPAITLQPDGAGRLTVIQHKTRRAIHRIVPAYAMQAVDRLMTQGKPRRIVLPLPFRRKQIWTEFHYLTELAGVGGSVKWLRRGSASEIERLSPGMGARHLGHAPGSQMFAKSYAVDRIVRSDMPLPPAPSFTPTLRIEHKPDAGKDGAA